MAEFLPPDTFDALHVPDADPDFTDDLCERYGIDRTLVSSIMPLPVEEFKPSVSTVPMRIATSAGRIIDADFSTKHTGDIQHFGDSLGLYTSAGFMLSLLNAYDTDMSARHPELAPWLTVVDNRHEKPQLLLLYHQVPDPSKELPLVPAVSPFVHAYPIGPGQPEQIDALCMTPPHEAGLHVYGGLGPAYPRKGDVPVPQALTYNAYWRFDGTCLRVVHDRWFDNRILALTSTAEDTDDRMRAGILTTAYYQDELIA